MPDPTTPPEGTPSNAEAPSIDWESPDNPYLTRFRDTQASYTQGQQRLSELERYEQDPNAFLELGKQKGWIEVEDPNAVNDEYLDPRLAQMIERDTAREERLAQLEARAQQEEHAASMAQFEENNAEWAKEAGITVSKSDHAAILGLLLQSPDPNSPDIHRQVFDAHAAHVKAQREALEAEIRESMRRPRVPTPPTGGQPATGAPAWGEMSEAQINEYMAERIAGRI